MQQQTLKPAKRKANKTPFHNFYITSIQLHTTLLDTITYLKFGRHLSLNADAFKQNLCELAGQKKGITYKNYLILLGLLHKDAGPEMEATFWKTIDKFGANIFLD